MTRMIFCVVYILVGFIHVRMVVNRPVHGIDWNLSDTSNLDNILC